MLLMLIYQMMPHPQQLLPLTPSVYVQPENEYCIVFLTNSLEYRMWISQLGELDVGAGNRLVSRQPSLGVLFKSQNNRTWNAVPSQDLKFTIHKASSFSSTSGTVT